MRAPLIAVVLAVAAAIFLCASAFLGVTAYADWTMFAAELCLDDCGGRFSRMVSCRLYQRNQEGITLLPERRARRFTLSNVSARTDVATDAVILRELGFLKRHHS